jgi:hypothetical protein
MNNRKITIPIIVILVLAVISLGIAFATFATTLNINGSATVDATNWEIVFEGLQNVNVLGSPTITGTATEVTHPTIKNNATEISDYEVTMQAPGDSVTYNFKIHNRGSYAAKVTSVDIKQGIYLTTNTSKRTSAAATLNNIQYIFYYTDNNALVGSGNEKDCLAPGEEENVTLKIIFNSSDNTGVLPSEDLVLDNLGVKVVYTQEDSCSSFSGGTSNINNNDNGPGVTSGTTGGGKSKKKPTVTGNNITGGKVSIPTSGDSVTYDIEYEIDTCHVVDEISVPSQADIAAANPDLTQAELANISITVTDSTGNSAVGMQIPANTPTILKVIIANSGGPISKEVIVPDIGITYDTLCPIPSAEYQTNVVGYEDSNHDYTYTYTWGSDADLIARNNNQMPNVYIKKVNGAMNTCLMLNSDEYCFTSTNALNGVAQFCNSVSGTFEADMASSGYYKSCKLSGSNINVVYLYGEGSEFGYDSPTGPFWVLTINYGNKECSTFNWDTDTDNGYCSYNSTFIKTY